RRSRFRGRRTCPCHSTPHRGPRRPAWWVPQTAQAMRARAGIDASLESSRDDARGESESKAEISQGGMVVRTPAERPVVLALGGGDRQVVDAGVADPHQALVVELPVLVPIGAEPVTTVVMPLIGKAHGDTVACERPQLLDESIVELPGPLASEER